MRFIYLLIAGLLLSACSSAWHSGEWTVSDVKFPAVSALGVEEARTWIGSEAVYTEAIVSFRGESCRRPQFQIESLAESDFRDTYRTTFAELGIEGETADIVKVNCTSRRWQYPGATFIKASRDTGYVPWDGAFFRLDRKAP